MNSENTELYDSKQLKDYIWKDYCDGVSTIELSKKYGISRSYCYQVINGMKGKSNENELALSKRITTMEKIIDQKDEEIQKLKEEVDLYKKLLSKLADK